MTRNVGASGVAGSINRTVRYLVQHGLADDQNTAFRRSGTGGRQDVVFQGVDSLSLALKKREYSETYARLSLSAHTTYGWRTERSFMRAMSATRSSTIPSAT